MSESIIVGVISGVLAILLWEFGKYAWATCSKWAQPDQFSILFRSHEPPGDVEVSKWGKHQIPIGNSEHWINLLCYPGLDLARFGVRFLPVEELSRECGDPPADIRSTIYIRDVDVLPEILIPNRLMTRVADRFGGIDVTFSPPVPVGTGKALVLKISVTA